MLPSKTQAFFTAFNYRNFRYLWIATMMSSAGRWMEAIVFGWLVLQMTGSPLMVGLVSACRWVGYGLGPVFGALCDRYNRRNLLIIINAFSILYSFSLAFLVTTQTIVIWEVVVISLAAGVAHSFDWPLRYAFASDLVDKKDLTNAVGLNTIATDVTAVLGPAIAGSLVNVIGIGGVGWVLTAVYAVNVVTAYLIRGVSTSERVVEESLTGNLKRGALYVRSNPPILALLLMAAAFNAFQFPLRYTLVPVLADNILQVGASGYGFILAASGGGALLGAALVAYLGDFKYKAWVCIITSLVAGIVAGLFSKSTVYPLSIGLITLVGLVEAISMTTMASLLLLKTPPEMRGRVMGLRSLAILPMTPGSLMTGAIANVIGAPNAGVVNAALQVGSMVAVVAMVPRLRKLG